MPREVALAAGADEDDLDREHLTPEWRAALASAAATTRMLFQMGRPIADAVNGRLKWELRATWLGGIRILDRLDAAGFDVFGSRPTLGWPDALLIGAKTITWRRAAP